MTGTLIAEATAAEPFRACRNGNPPLDIPLDPAVRFRLEVRAAALGMFNTVGQPDLLGFADFHMALFGAEGLSPREAFEAFANHPDADLRAFHVAHERGWAKPARQWSRDLTTYTLPPDVEARLRSRAAELGLPDLGKLVDACLLKRTAYERPTLADIHDLMADREDPDMATLARALFFGERIEPPPAARRH